MSKDASDQSLRVFESLLHEASANLRVYHNALERHAPSALIELLREAVNNSVRKVRIVRSFLDCD